MKKAIVLSSLLFVSSLAVSQAEGEFYRYSDGLGHVVITKFIPAERIPFGYDILDAAGRVIRSVDRELTAEEKANRSEESIALEKAKEQKARQEAYDLTLLRKYSFVSDIESEKARKVREMKVRATILNSNLNGVRSELEIEYEKAAKREKAGKKIGKITQKRIDELEEKIRTTEELLKKRNEDIESTRKEYLYAIERFKEVKAIINGSR